MVDSTLGQAVAHREAGLAGSDDDRVDPLRQIFPLLRQRLKMCLKERS